MESVAPNQRWFVYLNNHLYLARMQAIDAWWLYAHHSIYFKWLTLFFIGFIIVLLIFGLILPVELSDWRDVELFHSVIIYGLPVAIGLTAIWTISPEKAKRTNIIIGITTPVIAILTFFVSLAVLFYFESGPWVNEWIMYENRKNPEITINQQAMDLGQLGVGGIRVVKLQPFLGKWVIVSKVDTTGINKNEWKLVQQPGDFNKGF